MRYSTLWFWGFWLAFEHPSCDEGSQYDLRRISCLAHFCFVDCAGQVPDTTSTGLARVPAGEADVAQKSEVLNPIGVGLRVWRSGFRVKGSGFCGSEG